MNELKWNPEIFEGEFGKLTDNAFEILNCTEGIHYGYDEFLHEGVDLVTKYFYILDDAEQKCKSNKFINEVSDFLNSIEQSYYRILKYRKQKDLEYKIKTIEEDF